MTPHAASAATPPGEGRIAALDAARAVAVLAMVVYHSAWDLGELRLIATDIRAVPAWNWFARAIAASFLVLVGVSLQAAHRRGIRLGAFARRLAMVGAAAALVTLATWWVFPGAYVFFGILHCIAASSVLAVPFLRAPPLLTGAAAVLVWTLPSLVAGGIFDAAPLAFLGLARHVSPTNDYVPLCPWFGFVLAGLAAARRADPALERSRTTRPERERSRTMRFALFVGRHSLLVYLLHQPIIFGALAAWAEWVGRDPVAEAAPFRDSFVRSCRGSGGADAACRAAADCTVAALKRDGSWSAVAEDRLDAATRIRLGELAGTCFEAAGPGRDPAPH